MKNELFQIWLCLAMLALRDLAVAGQSGYGWRAVASLYIAVFAMYKSVAWCRAAKGGA